MNNINEDIINECEFLIVNFEEKKLNGQNLFVSYEPIRN